MTTVMSKTFQFEVAAAGRRAGQGPPLKLCVVNKGHSGRWSSSLNYSVLIFCVLFFSFFFFFCFDNVNCDIKAPSWPVVLAGDMLLLHLNIGSNALCTGLKPHV